MLDPKKLLDDLLGSQIPGTDATVRDKAGQAVQMAKDNPLAAGAIAAVLLGTGAGRQVTGTSIRLGGLAAILSADHDRYDRYDRNDRRYRGRYDDPRYGYGYDYGRYGNSRAAVSQCVNAVERGTSRYGRTDVTQVTSIDRKRDGYRVKGRVVVNDGWRGRWGRGGSYDRGKFSCDVRYGRVVDVDYSGLR